MKPTNKKIANLVFALAASLAAVGSISQVDPAVEVNHEVFGPSIVEAGALVLLNVQGDDVQWEVFPEVPIETYGDDNAFLATAFKDAGDYLVVCAFTDTDGRVRIEKQLIASEEPESAVTIPDEPPEIVILNPPTTIPVVIPPEPVPDNFVDTKYPEVRSSVAEVAANSNLSKETARVIGQNFAAVAARIAAGAYDNPTEVLRDTAALNRPLIKVGAVTTQIQLIVSQKRFNKEVVGLEDYQDLWTEIAEGLIGYATR